VDQALKSDMISLESCYEAQGFRSKQLNKPEVRVPYSPLTE
jgi:hypothetical protein